MTYHGPEDFERDYGKPGSWKRFWTVGIPLAIVIGTITGIAWKFLVG